MIRFNSRFKISSETRTYHLPFSLLLFFILSDICTMLIKKMHIIETSRFEYTVGSAKKDPFCPVLTLTGGVTLVFLHLISKRKICLSFINLKFKQVLFVSVLYVRALFSSYKPLNLEVFLIRRSF